MSWTPSASSARPLSTLRNGTTLLLLPEVLGGALAVDLAVHRPLEQDGAEDAVAVEGRALDDAGPHLVHEVEHLVVVAEGRLVDAVQLERLRRAAAALVEGGDEAGPITHFLELLLVHARSLTRSAMPVRQPSARGRAPASSDAGARSPVALTEAGIGHGPDLDQIAQEVIGDGQLGDLPVLDRQDADARQVHPVSRRRDAVHLARVGAGGLPFHDDRVAVGEHPLGEHSEVGGGGLVRPVLGLGPFHPVDLEAGQIRVIVDEVRVEDLVRHRQITLGPELVRPPVPEDLVLRRHVPPPAPRRTGASAPSVSANDGALRR